VLDVCCGSGASALPEAERVGAGGRGFNPWERLPTPAAVADLVADGGVAGAEVVAEEGVQPLRSPEDGWAVVLGTGYRGTLEQLSPAAGRRVRDSVLAALAGVTSIQTNVVYATARRRA
jgi:hypothetical protein